MTGMDERLAKVAEVLHEHDWFTPRGYAFVCCACGEEFPEDGEEGALRHQAAALGPLLGEWQAEDEARALRAVEAVDFTSRRLGSATGDPWVAGWNDALKTCQADLRAALAAAEPDAGHACAGCRAPLRESRGLNTCDTAGCPGNLRIEPDAGER